MSDSESSTRSRSPLRPSKIDSKIDSNDEFDVEAVVKAPRQGDPAAMFSVRIGGRDQLPKNATKEEITAIFEPFGEIGDVFLPKGRPNHRGYGFVRFLKKTSQENCLCECERQGGKLKICDVPTEVEFCAPFVKKSDDGEEKVRPKKSKAPIRYGQGSTQGVHTGPRGGKGGRGGRGGRGPKGSRRTDMGNRGRKDRDDDGDDKWSSGKKADLNF